MNTHLFSLLAETNSASTPETFVERWVAMSGHGSLVGVAVLIALGWSLYPVVKRHLEQRRGAAIPAPAPPRKSVFVELCDRHDLNSEERSLLSEAAQAGSVESPALLFVNPALLDALATAQPELADRCQALRERLFAEPQLAGSSAD